MEKHYLRCGVKMVSTPAPLQSLGYDGSVKTLARIYICIINKNVCIYTVHCTDMKILLHVQIVYNS